MMPPIILTVLQGLFLILLYLFVARAVGAVIRDVTVTSGRSRKARPAQPPQPAASPRRAPEQRRQPDQAQQRPQPAARADRLQPREIVVHSPSGAPRVMPLDGDEITFGRSERSTVPLKDPYTSDRHARIYHDGEHWLLVDLGSTNGTFLNQVKVTEPTPIAAGDQLGIGRTVVEVRK